MEGKEILRLVDGLHRNKDIDEEVIFLAIESALQSAARKHFGAEADVTVEIDRSSGDMVAIRNGERVEPGALGRIAAQAAKQVIIQKIREAESDTIHAEYIERVGELITGAVQRFESGALFVDMGRTEAVLPRSEQVPGEHYQAGERIKALILDVRKVNNLVQIVLSRSSPDLIRRFFELEVPEVAEGVVQIRRIAREPGLRTKIAVESLDARVDCIGACVGVRGTRIKSIIDEVRGEKIDIIPWSEAPETLIADSLRPAEILQITLEEGEHTKRAVVTVPEDQLSLAIGWKGQNVRLAVKMSGWDIDIEPPAPTEEELAEAMAEAQAVEEELAEPIAEAEAAQETEAAGEPAHESMAMNPGGETESDSDAAVEPDRQVDDTTSAGVEATEGTEQAG